MRNTRRNPKKKQPTPKPSSEENESGSSSQQQESSSGQKVEANIKTLQFRKRRGQKMKNLMNKKIQQDEDDDFWKNNAYFGDDENLSEGENQEQSYVESSGGQDQFDSDFLSNKSDQQKEKQEQQEEVFVQDEDKSTTKRKRGYVQPTKAPIKKGKPTPATPPPSANKPITLKYIHQQFTQQQLLAEAAHTQYYNFLSLQKLISLEEGKKTYHRKHIQIPQPKIIYKNRIIDDKIATTYTMIGFEEGTNFLDIECPF